jgi:hypothetical protein
MLSSFFSSASVVNSTYTPLANSQSACTSNAWGNGCAYVESSSGGYQNGQSYNANALLILPPASSSDFAKVSFVQPSNSSLLPSYEWSLNGTYGIQFNSSNASNGVQVQIVVSGDPIDSSDTPWAVIDSFTVNVNSVFSRATPLGTWPLRNGFSLAIQVSAIGDNNYYDDLVIDGLTLSPTVPRPTMGIAQSNLVWNSNPLPIVSAIGSMGSTWLRTNMRSASLAPTFASVVVSANKAGMHVIAQILTDSEDYDNPAAATGNNTSAFSELCGNSGGAMKVSQIDVSLFTQRFTTYLQALKAAGASVDAFEIGNELDWVCFNGDIPLGASGITASNLTPFIEKYAQLLQAAKNGLMVYYPDARLITFGAANCYLFSLSSCVQDPQNLLVALQNVGGINYLNLVDGFGEHLYPSSSNISAALTALQNMSNALGDGKPFWITEWGFGNAVGQTRYLEFRQFLELMNSTGLIPVAHLLLYDYSSNDGFSLLSGGTSGTVDPEARILAQYSSLIAP